MKRLKILAAFLAALLSVSLLFSGCGTILVTKNGEVKTGEAETRQYDFSDFTRVEIGSAFKYEITQSDTYSIRITTNSNLFDDIKVAREGQTLVINTEFPEAPWAFKINTDSSSKAVITMPQLNALDGSGATNGTVTGFSSTEELDVTASGASTVALAKIAAGATTFQVSGASTVTGDIAAGDIEFQVSGASNVSLKGSADNLDANVSGASNLKLAEMPVGDADVILSGASYGIVNLDGRLDAGLSGASTLEYEGQPSLGNMNITGASTLQEK